jgi:CBS domain-containing protein
MGSKGNVARARKPAPTPAREGLPRVRDVMSTAVEHVSPDQQLSDAIGLFAEKRFRHLLVTTDGKLAGVLSDRDVLRFLARHPGGSDKTVADAMTPQPTTTGPDSSLAEAVKVLIEKRINCLPVVIDDGVVKGILTTTDLLRALHSMVSNLERGAAASA